MVSGKTFLICYVRERQIRIVEPHIHRRDQIRRILFAEEVFNQICFREIQP